MCTFPLIMGPPSGPDLCKFCACYHRFCDFIFALSRCHLVPWCPSSLLPPLRVSLSPERGELMETSHLGCSLHSLSSSRVSVFICIYCSENLLCCWLRMTVNWEVQKLLGVTVLSCHSSRMAVFHFPLTSLACLVSGSWLLKQRQA